MHSECVTPQLKELEQLKLSPSTKIATSDTFITHKKKHTHTQEAVLNAESIVTK